MLETEERWGQGAKWGEVETEGHSCFPTRFPVPLSPAFELPLDAKGAEPDSPLQGALQGQASELRKAREKNT